jgi:diguanylate cyclase (GGDEF)-like protein/PAS domain S-box-containing protein
VNTQSLPKRNASTGADRPQSVPRVLDRLLEGCTLFGFDWTYLYINEAAARQANQTIENLLGRTLPGMFPGIERTELFSRHRVTMEQRIAQVFESSYTFPDGTCKWYEITSEPVAEGLFVLSLDITERKRNENALREAELRYRTFATASFEGIVVTEDGRFSDVNVPFQKMLGYRRDELIGQEISNFLAPLDQQLVLPNIRTGQPSRMENHLIHKDGTEILVEAHGQTIEIGGRAVRLTAIRDITESRKAEEALRKSEAQFRQLVETSPIPMIVATPPPEGSVVLLNRRFTEIFGYVATDIPDLAAWWPCAYPDSAYRKETQERWDARLQQMVTAGLNYFQQPFAVDIACKDGTSRHVEISLTVHPDRCLVILNDVTDKRRSEDELRKMATTDFLTGLASRRSFVDRLEDELARLHRAAEQPVALLMLDLDYFKRVNDRYGHSAGDELLRHFAKLIDNELRRIDMAGRLGGEEFGVVLPGADAHDAMALATRLCERAADSPLNADGQSIHFSVSIGVTDLRFTDSTPTSVLSRADKALYRAKELGRNRVELAVDGL